MSSKKEKIATKKYINVTGAREHNLKNIDVKIPKDSITVITGLSGSGKSSLAFDTIYAEGQRRYVESLSAYARQFLEMMQKPDLDQIDGLSPAIAIEQKTTSKNPRSTVGTVTEVYDYLRLLFARIGVPHSPATGLPITSQTVTQMVDQVNKNKEGTKAFLLAPIVRGRKGEYKKEFSNLLKKGFQRIKIDGEFYELDNVPNLEKNIKHDIDVVVDRIVIDKKLGNRLADSFETALQLADGLAAIEIADGKDKGKRIIYSANYSCPESGFTIEEIEPRLFSFNNPVGACQNCDGLGTEYFIDKDLVIPNHDLSIRAGAIAPWSRTSSPSPFYLQTLMAISEHYGFSIDCKWSDLPTNYRDIILDGSGDEKIIFNYDDGSRTFKTNKTFEGIIKNLKRRYIETDSNWMREEIEKYQSKSDCSKCNGYRLKEEALCIKINKDNIGQISKLTIDESLKWFQALPSKLSKKDTEISKNIIKEIGERLTFLKNVGLNYLTLSRESGTLSGGESQRIRLASQIGSGLTGVLYVLDEPSIGLHQRDNDKLLGTLERLKNLGNTVIVVEHDEETMNAADHIIDIGPGAGIHGGYLVAEGTFDKIANNKKSITGQYLSKKKVINIPEKREINNERMITINKANGNNLKNVSANFPLSTFTCVLVYLDLVSLPYYSILFLPH